MQFLRRSRVLREPRTTHLIDREGDRAEGRGAVAELAPHDLERQGLVHDDDGALGRVADRPEQPFSSRPGSTWLGWGSLSAARAASEVYSKISLFCVSGYAVLGFGTFLNC